MKKTIGITLIIALIAGISFTGCKKYDDGPMLSVQPKKMRLVNEWKIEKVFYNGVEQSVGSLLDETYEFKSNGDYIITASAGSYSSSTTGTWEWDSNKEGIKTTIPSAVTSKILRLKANELWLENTSILGIITETHYVSN
jgi:uncharacterized protein YaiE (UPF0345 family)